MFPRISCPGTFLSDSPVPGVDGGNSLSQKMAEATRCTHELGYLFERHGGLGRSDALLNGLDEALNFRDMLLFMHSFGL